MPATATSAARTQYYCYDSTTRRLASLRSAANCGGTVQTSLTYDARGNIATKGGMTFDFDLTNRLKSIDNGGVVENYRYDGYGLRALKNASSGNLWSQYTRDGRLLQETNARTTTMSDYVYLGDSLVAIQETPTTGGTAVVKYQHTDALGTPVAVTSASRTVLVRNEYEPYGQLLNHTITDAVGYTGHVQDGMTGLTYMQQRYYDPMIGRFLSVDPVTAYDKPLTNFNRYAYGNNNPYRFTDPDGRLSRTGSHLREGTTVGMETSAHTAEIKVLQKADKSGPAKSDDPNVAPVNDALKEAAPLVSYSSELTDVWNETDWIYDPTNPEFTKKDSSTGAFSSPAEPFVVRVGPLAKFARAGQTFGYKNAEIVGGQSAMLFSVLHEFGHVWNRSQHRYNNENTANTFAYRLLPHEDQGDISCPTCELPGRH
jgi:RHS repeat-associated protein